jgi:hypothetical protein
VPFGAWWLLLVLWGLWMMLVGFVFAFTPWLSGYALAAWGF